MWKKLLITGCMAFCLLGEARYLHNLVVRQRKKLRPEQLNRTKKGLDAMLKELKNNSWYQSELNKAASLATPSEQMQAYKSLAGRLISVLEIQAELEWMKPEAIQEALGIMKKEFGF